MMKSNAPTMKDVAREAGVALGTVSKVINHIPVGEVYQKKVEQAIKKLGYEVNTYARGLKTQRTKIITLIVPDTMNPFYSAFTHYIENAVYEHGLKLMLCCSNGIPEKEIEYLNLASQNKTDGIIALTYSDISSHVPKAIPLIALDRYFESGNIPVVASDNYAGGYMAVKKLLDSGCRHPVFIRFHSSFPGEADKRKDGYLAACKDYDIVPDYLDEMDGKDESAAIMKFVTDHQMPGGTLSFDGVFANTDYHGYMMLKLLRKMGYKIPEDIQIIGFDGIYKFGIADKELFVSSICQPVRELAAACIDIVLKAAHEMVPSLTLLPIQFKDGGTTKEQLSLQYQPAQTK